MKDNILAKLVQHPDKDDIVTKLVIGTDVKFIHKELKTKYDNINKNLILSIKHLLEFKENYLNYYLQIQEDAVKMSKPTSEVEVEAEVKSLVQSNSAYRQKLEEYLDQEIDIKKVVKNLVVAIEFRASQVFDNIQANPNNTKMDYVLINYMNSLVNVLEKYDAIINGNQDKILQQNNINIQILDQHVYVFQKVIREVISRLDNDVSLVFIDILNDELRKMKPSTEILSADDRLLEVKQIENSLLTINSEISI